MHLVSSVILCPSRIGQKLKFEVDNETLEGAGERDGGRETGYNKRENSTFPLILDFQFTLSFSGYYISFSVVTLYLFT